MKSHQMQSSGWVGFGVDIAREEIAQTRDGTFASAFDPVRRSGDQVEIVRARDVAPAEDLVFAHGEEDHGYRIEVFRIADRKSVERSLQAGFALHQFLHVGGLAALVIDDDAIVVGPEYRYGRCGR